MSTSAAETLQSLEILGVSKTFTTGGSNVQALAATDLTIRPHEFVSLLGPSGCGKSTLLRIMAGLTKATSGRVSLNGRTVTGPGPDRGMVFQAYTLFPWRTVLRNITFGLEQQGRKKSESRRTADTYIDLVGLREFEHSYPSALSGGMKQRVALARALAAGPEVLLLDEPFGALDMQTRESMQDLLRSVWERTRTTVIMVTHDIDEAVLLSDRVVVMTGHPGVIQDIIPIQLPAARSSDTRLSQEFMSYRRKATLSLHGQPATEAEADAAGPVK